MHSLAKDFTVGAAADKKKTGNQSLSLENWLYYSVIEFIAAKISFERLKDV